MPLGGETSQTLDRGLRVLEQLAEAGEAGLSISALAERLEVGRPVVYRLVATLAEHDLARRHADGHVRLGLGLLPLAAATHATVRQAAQPVLRALASSVGATAHLTVADGDEALAIAVEEPRLTDYHVGYRVGSTHPVTRGAAGRAIVAGRSGDPAVVESEGELQPGAHGFAAPVLGVAGLEASVGVVTLGPLDAVATRRDVSAAAVGIAAALGAPRG